MHTDSIF